MAAAPPAPVEGLALGDVMGWFPNIEREQKRAILTKWQRAEHAHAKLFFSAMNYGEHYSVRADAHWLRLCDMLRLIKDDYDLICEALDNYLPDMLQSERENMAKTQCFGKEDHVGGAANNCRKNGDAGAAPPVGNTGAVEPTPLRRKCQSRVH
jgi:hypothetical protein